MNEHTQNDTYSDIERVLDMLGEADRCEPGAGFEDSIIEAGRESHAVRVPGRRKRPAHALAVFISGCAVAATAAVAVIWQPFSSGPAGVPTNTTIADASESSMHDAAEPLIDDELGELALGSFDEVFGLDEMVTARAVEFDTAELESWAAGESL